MSFYNVLLVEDPMLDKLLLYMSSSENKDRVTGDALLAETITHLLSYECFHCS